MTAKKMPIFHHPETSSITSSGKSTSDNAKHVHALSEWTDHQLADVEMGEASPLNYQLYGQALSLLPSADRNELIQSIKRRESPLWSTRELNAKSDLGTQVSRTDRTIQSWSVEPKMAREESPSRYAQHGISSLDSENGLAQPSEIERPRSALHSGDFREGAAAIRSPEFSEFESFNSSPHGSHSFKRFGSSPTTPWFNHTVHSKPTETTSMTPDSKSIMRARSRAPSLGSFPSYVLKAPTSPLVHQANNTDLDYSPSHEHAKFPTTSSKNIRRRTLPPETFMQLRGSPPRSSRTSNLSRSFFTSAQSGEGLRHQAYQPHRSSTYSLQPASSPHALFRPRRPSFASDLSPRIHASMVGSYEESILRGRMSTTPSKPLDFTAKIGVLGKGKCKANLRCPPHITVPFPAVFYSYPTSGAAGRSISDDSPSPYVGLIDLENSLPRESSRHRGQKPTTLAGCNNTCAPISGSNMTDRHKQERRSGRSDATKAPPGGAYRIAQRGQLQIVIQNPNKTAVKLFLVPYDLDDMEPGTKTFIRQRSYSAGPIIDMPLAARRNLGTDRPEASLNPTNDPKDRPTLRYLIHLNICCPAKGRFYLHSTIRVVFANRVPDGKEKLRNEIQYPEPRYSPYKPLKEANTAVYRSAIDGHVRRRSAGVGFTGGQYFEGQTTSPYPQHSPFEPSSNMQVTPVPFKLSVLTSRGSESSTSDAGRTSAIPGAFWHTGEPASSDPSPHEDMSIDGSLSPGTSSSNYLAGVDNGNGIETEDNNSGGDNDVFYNKLQKGDAGYGSGYSYPSLSPGYPSPNQSLLAQTLKDWNCNSEQYR